jgi:hypothetical protein
MARGWESKSVESQKEDAGARRQKVEPPLSPEEQQRRRELEGLLLSRTRVRHDLERAVHPRHRASVEAALQFIEAKIRALEQPPTMIPQTGCPKPE